MTTKHKGDEQRSEDVTDGIHDRPRGVIFTKHLRPGKRLLKRSMFCRIRSAVWTALRRVTECGWLPKAVDIPRCPSPVR